MTNSFDVIGPGTCNPEPRKSAELGLSDSNALVRRCAACSHWQGDKDEAKRIYAENPVSMDLFKGWPNQGVCGIDYEWLNLEIRGDACVSNETDANFGCIYFDA